MKKFTFVFVLIMIAEILAIHYQWLYPNIQYFTKPLILLSLIAFLLVATKRNSSVFKRAILIALLFSLSGDILLMFEKQNPVFFMFGLGAFLLSHLFYIYSFNQPGHPSHDIPFLKKHPWFIFLVIVAGVYMFQQLQPKLHEMVLPVIVYLIVILAMFSMAINRWGKVNKDSFFWVSGGAFLFVVSDGILAFNKFHSPIENARFAIMISYMLAQYSIVRGAYLQITENGH